MLDFLAKHILHWAASRAHRADIIAELREQGVGHDWKAMPYADYFFRSSAIYAAARLRGETLARAHLRVYRPTLPNEFDWVEMSHPAQRILDTPNSEMSQADLVQAIEIQAVIHGEWILTIENMMSELWPQQPNKMHPIPSLRGRRAVRGYVYNSDTGQSREYLAQEVVRGVKYNPDNNYVGASPIAPARLTADMAHDATKMNRNTFVNGGMPAILFLTETQPTEAELRTFFAEWERRYSGPEKGHRPGFAPNVKEVVNVAHSNRDLQWRETLDWYVEEVARVTGVPQPFLASLKDATLQNVDNLYKVLWETTLIPESIWIAQRLSADLMPKLGYPNLKVAFDLSDINALQEAEESRIKREEVYLDRGAISIEEVRARRGMPEQVSGTLATTARPADPDSPRNEEGSASRP